VQKSHIDVTQVTKNFRQGSVVTPVLQGITTQFVSGNSYAITGASGSGKSTLLHLLAGLDVPSSGTVSYDGVSLATLKEPEITAFLAHSIGLMFQDPHLIRELSVIENVMIKGVIAGMSEDQARARAHELLTLFGLADKATHTPSSLSGGQQQMVALARALVNKPKFILADEPTGNLDAESGKRVMDELVRCVGEGMGLIVCSHDPYVTKRMTTILSLKDGQLV
jgi:lipoprotein-releasing system ATP-binding protein